MKGRLYNFIVLSTCLVVLFVFGAGNCYAQAFVVKDTVNFHTGPGLQYQILGTLQRGQQVQVTAHYGDWLEIALNQGAKGYALARFFRPANGSGYAPVPPANQNYMAPPPPPGQAYQQQPPVPDYQQQPNPGYRQPPPPRHHDYYAAIAHSFSTKRYFISKNLPSAEAAEAEAVRGCGGGDCRSLRWVKNGCISIAANDRADAFSSWGHSKQESADKTMQVCRGYGCRVLKTFCTKR